MYTSNKTLLQILVEELPKHGGWPSDHRLLGAVQDFDHEVKFYIAGFVLKFELNSKGVWGSDRHTAWLLNYSFKASNLASDYATAIITRDQYESALAASKAVVGHNGWIDWHGGECPVDSDAIVEVKYRKPNPYQFNNDRAGDFTWSHHGIDGDIIAYRLQQPHEVKTAGIDVQRDAAKSNDAQLEADLNDCIGQGIQADEKARNALLVDMARAGTDVSLIIAYDLADFLIAQGYRKQ